jgi:Arc/MetJ family transcription regulator
MNSGLIDSFHIAWAYVGVALLMLVSCEIGYRFGRFFRSRQDSEASTSIGPMVGGLLGLLAFVLAFTFSIAASQYNQRKQNVLLDASAIATAYLRSDLLDEPYETSVKKLLREYVNIRLQAVQMQNMDRLLARSREIQNLLWSQVSAAAKATPGANASLMVQSVNNMFDMQKKRVTESLRTRIPGSIWIALFAINALTMITMGTQVGLTGKRRLVAVVPLSLAFAVLVTLVVDLDRPQGGLITVGQQVMVDLQGSMGTEAN